MRNLSLVVGLAVCLCVVAPSGASASRLSDIIKKGNHLIVLNRLGLTPQQLEQIAPLSQELVEAVEARQDGRDRILEDARESLSEARVRLLQGEPLTPRLATQLEETEAALEKADDTLYQTAVEVLEEIEETFTAQQNAYVDWTPPRGSTKSSRETLAQQAQRARDHQAMVMMGERFLHSIRYYPLEQYVMEAQRLVDDFLRPLIDPRSPQYPAARQYMFRLVDQVRVMQEAEWIERGHQVAESMIRELGLEQPVEAPADRPYTWQDMYEIFSDLGAPDMLKEMRAARRVL